MRHTEGTDLILFSCMECFIQFSSATKNENSCVRYFSAISSKYYIYHIKSPADGNFQIRVPVLLM